MASVIAGATSAERLHKMQLRWEEKLSASDRMELDAARGEVQPWRTNLSQMGELSREALLPPLGAVRLLKKCPSAFPLSIWKYQSCGSPRRVHFSRICLNS